MTSGVFKLAHTHYYCTYLLSKSKLPFNRNPCKIALGLKFGQIIFLNKRKNKTKFLNEAPGKVQTIRNVEIRSF